MYEVAPESAGYALSNYGPIMACAKNRKPGRLWTQWPNPVRRYPWVGHQVAKAKASKLRVRLPTPLGFAEYPH
jgi:hypothetical protein